MSLGFRLLVYTPEKVFFDAEVLSVTVETPSGRLSVLAGHIPMVCALNSGKLIIKTQSGTRLAFHSEGFMEVERDRAEIFAQACEWPEEIDRERALSAAKRAETRMKETIGTADAAWSNVALIRARARLSTKEVFEKESD